MEWDISLKKNSLKFYLWIDLAIFSFLILALFWLFQVIFLNSYYKYFKKKDMNNVAREVVESYRRYNNDYDLFNVLSYKNNVCIEIIKDDSISYTSGASNGCLLHDNKILKEQEEKLVLN